MSITVSFERSRATKKLRCHYCGKRAIQGRVVNRRVSRRTKKKVFVCRGCCKKKGIRE